MDNLSKNAKKVLLFISEFQAENGYSPSIPEIMGGTGIKSNRGVSLQLEKLQNLGYIHRDRQARRAIKVLVNPVTQDTEKVKVPLVGEIRAGQPNYAEENIEDYYKVPTIDVHGRTDAFLLRVKGDSMTKAGFNEGDLAIVVPEEVPRNGDIVVAFMPDDDVATLKRYKKMDSYVVLLPESYNPEHKPIIEKNIMIQGIVLGKFTE